MNAKLIAVTQPVIRHDKEDRNLTPDELIAYAARVSNPSNQQNHETAPRLLAYCLKHKHWSVFETASMTVEVTTSRAIAAQILRHRSFTFQEFSQRYAVATEFEPVELRSQDQKNRQGSGEVISGLLAFDDDDYPPTATEAVEYAVRSSAILYQRLVSAGVSKETARMILPLCTQTTLYITGNVRSWIHYFDQRCSPHAQKEHRLLAEMIREIFKAQFPSVWEAVQQP